mmetsp:Transcript_43085/g.71630  ORF Transcript_43085/g.71630 Transcript_43085/m.71630 type:complete len:154 (+) Transcript_43085:83-544(+)
MLDVSKLKVAELREELEKRGLDTSGLKPKLLERLKNAISQEEGDAPVAKPAAGEGPPAPAKDVEAPRAPAEHVEAPPAPAEDVEAPPASEEAAVGEKRKRDEVEPEAPAPLPHPNTRETPAELLPKMNMEHWCEIEDRHSEISGIAPFVPEFE